MKTRMRHFSYILMFTLFTNTMYAQTPGKEQALNPPHNNVTTKNAKTVFYPRIVSWWDSGNGFICKVSVDNVVYMTRFDKQGKYVETLMKKVWNETSSLQAAFQQSAYNRQKVTGYWEVTDANKKGYYLEMNNSQNNVTSVWVDDQGNFSTIPSTRIKSSVASK